MNFQNIAIIILFIGAVFYVARLIYNTLKAKKSCSSGCKKCAVDFSATEIKKNKF
ncbi:FeoB-associated Cys-rich membrane protein [Pedobacter alpinus]|uniref:FeoB-associated Cys-rich membrane protein n=1 Tax=Pedobacter alpinus TaxID=1590643 RepID=A0ABW5TPW3_9SPHI